MHPIICAPTPITPSYQNLFCLNNRWVIAHMVLISYDHKLSKVDFETEVSGTIVWRRHRTRIRWNNAKLGPLLNSVKYRKIRAISPFKVIQGHRFWYYSKAHIRRLIKTVAIQVLRIKSWIYEFARNLYRGRRAVPLQTFTTGHSNRKLSIVMALSTTFTQCARKLPNSVKNNEKRAISQFKVIQGHRFWYQSKAHIWLSISD